MELDRCDKPLTKADLVAIIAKRRVTYGDIAKRRVTYGDIIALEPKHAANAETLSSTMTIPD